MSDLQFIRDRTDRLPNIPEQIWQVHERALLVSERYKKSEGDLLEAILAVREKKVYRYFECSSVFEYCVKVLKLDAGIVYGFMAVAKKSEEVPELKEKIKSRELSVATAKRITSVITEQNKMEWFAKAENLTIRQLEKAVATSNPKEEVREHASYLSSKRVRLELGLDENLMLRLRRIQDLESRKNRCSVSLEQVLSVMTEIYLTKNDPLEKAKRAIIRKSETRRETNPSARKDLLLTASGHRQPIPAKTLHKIKLRDRDECQYVNSKTGEKCREKRFLEIHHKRPVSLGGQNNSENLTTLCSEHHKVLHWRKEFANKVTPELTDSQ
jgi:5-methylcytosine-specific restriction endonuclease McrA